MVDGNHKSQTLSGLALRKIVDPILGDGGGYYLANQFFIKFNGRINRGFIIFCSFPPLLLASVVMTFHLARSLPYAEWMAVSDPSCWTPLCAKNQCDLSTRVFCSTKHPVVVKQFDDNCPTDESYLGSSIFRELFSYKVLTECPFAIPCLGVAVHKNIDNERGLHVQVHLPRLRADVHQTLHTLDETARCRLVSRVWRRIGAALCTLHSNGLVYRDLKTNNILIDDNMFPFLFDFDVTATTRTASSDLVRTNFVDGGANTFLAPEIRQAQYTETFCDAKVDSWSLGVVTLILLSSLPTNFADAAALRHGFIGIYNRCGRSRERSKVFPPTFWSVLARLLLDDPIQRASMLEVSQVFGGAVVPGTSFLFEPWPSAVCKAMDRSHFDSSQFPIIAPDHFSAVCEWICDVLDQELSQPEALPGLYHLSVNLFLTLYTQRPRLQANTATYQTVAAASMLLASGLIATGTTLTLERLVYLSDSSYTLAELDQAVAHVLDSFTFNGISPFPFT